MHYNVISADCHLNEPPDTYTARVASKLHDRVPRVEPAEGGGERWVFDDVGCVAFGPGTAVLARGKVCGPLDYVFDLTHAEVARGSWDPVAHLEDMSQDGVDASVLYSGEAANCWNLRDREVRLASIRAYNEWLAEFCSSAPERLIGSALLPVEEETLDAALAELDRVLALGFRQVEVPIFPRRRYYDPFYAPLWEAIQAAGIPVAIHRGIRQPAGLGGSWEGPFVPNHILWDFSYAVPLGDFVFGVFDSFPELTLVSGEGRIGWLAFFAERLDDSYRRHRHHMELPPLQRSPSEYLRENVYSTFVSDRTGVLLREQIGVERQMWSSDYPHSDSTWPESRRCIEDQFEGVPESDRRLMLAGNAARLYRLGGIDNV